MHTRRSLLSLLAVGFLSILVLAACSGGKLGYGVVLWAPSKSSVKTGQIVTVKQQSTINNTYSILVSGNTITVPNWRVKLFKGEQKAINFSLAYSQMVPMFAKATVNGVIIRQKPNAGSTQIYRMRQGQVIKVIAKEPKKVTVDGVDGHWYQVLTGDGVLGYSFGSNLSVYNPAVETQKQVSAGQQLLDKVLSTTYRPQYFKQMISTNQIDLSRFGAKYGFFANAKAKQLKIVMPDYSLRFTYSGITKRATGDYAFNGTPVEMIIKSPDKIQLLYSDSKGNQYDKVFVHVKQDIGYLVEKEKNRRLQIYSSFLDKAPYASSYYGKIALGPNMGFTWTGYSRLVPNIIPTGAGPTGVVKFPLFLSPNLQGSYSGAITFVFGAKPATDNLLFPPSTSSNTDLASLSPVAPGNSPKDSVSSGRAALSLAPSGQGSSSSGKHTVSFLYSFTANGVKLTYVPQSDINKDIVTNVSSTPLVIVFQEKGATG